MGEQDRIPPSVVTPEAQDMAQRHGAPPEEPSREPSAEVMREENQADEERVQQPEAAQPGTELDESALTPTSTDGEVVPEPSRSLPANQQGPTGTAVATEAPPPPKGTQFIDEGDVWLARVTFSGKLGRFIDELTGEEEKEFAVVPLLVSKSRVYFYDARRDPDEFGEAVILCKSSNAMEPTDSHPKLWTVHGVSPATVCMDCPFSQWGPNKERPKCRLSYNFLCVKPGETEPFRISFHSTSTRAVRQLLSQIKRSRRPMFSYIQRLRAEEQKGPEGTYYSLALGTPEWIPDTDLGLYDDLYDEIMRYGDADVIDLLGGGRTIQASAGTSSNGKSSPAPQPRSTEEVPF